MSCRTTQASELRKAAARWLDECCEIGETVDVDRGAKHLCCLFDVTAGYAKTVIRNVCDDLTWVGMTEKIQDTSGYTRNHFHFTLIAHRADLSSEATE